MGELKGSGICRSHEIENGGKHGYTNDRLHYHCFHSFGSGDNGSLVVSSVGEENDADSVKPD
ncbi:MAG: hypothetical protein RHS_5569 [Robinsoniella sp. RHS]|nr:MAG: hypothetical protein RHS_5569 [Robinsoniella sp. RHS]